MKEETIFLHTKPQYVEVIHDVIKHFGVQLIDVKFEKRADGKQGKPIKTGIQARNRVTVENYTASKHKSEIKSIRVTFAGVIKYQTEDNVELHIGVAKQGIHDTFSKKKGRAISYKRALGCPVLIVYCTRQEVIPIFHKKCKELENSVIFDDLVKCAVSHTPKVHESLQDILEETSAD